MFKTQFTNKHRHTVCISTETHPLFEEVSPLTPAQMLRKVANGQPLSCPLPKPNLPLNHKFFNDKFDILDTAIAVNRRLSEETKRQMKEQRELELKQKKEFEEWKKSQTVNHQPDDLTAQ